MSRPGPVPSGGERGYRPSLAQRLGFPVLRALGWSLGRLVSGRWLGARERVRRYGARFRGTPALLADEAGELLCVGCGLCTAACPASCLRVEPSSDEPAPPALFELDLLRCLYCGYCVDACPEGAMAMSRASEAAFTQREEGTVSLIEPAHRLGHREAGRLGFRPWKASAE